MITDCRQKILISQRRVSVYENNACLATFFDQRLQTHFPRQRKRKLFFNTAGLPVPVPLHIRHCSFRSTRPRTRYESVAENSMLRRQLQAYGGPASDNQ